MHVKIASLIFSIVLPLVAATPVVERAPSCSVEQRIAGAAQFVKTIDSHSLEDAYKIPLAPTCPRNIFLTPDETAAINGGVPILVPLGFDAQSTRLLLVAAATALRAGVPPPVNYTLNANNGSVTADFIQTDYPELKRVHVRQIHNYDMKTCLINSILTFALGKVTP